MSNDRRYELFDYVSRAGLIYGVEDFAFFLYALVRMQKPLLMLELGSGGGSCSLMCARAMQENGIGKVVSVDNGSQWERISTHPEIAPFKAGNSVSHQMFLRGLSERFGVQDSLTYLEATFPPFPELADKIDLLFSDYQSGPVPITAIVAHFLPRMAESASIFIDSASTGRTSFLFLEMLIGYLNAGKLPAALYRLIPEQSLADWIRLLHTRRFTLVHLAERKERDQNSTAWIKIEPVDFVPYPLTRMR
jgi:predicted O-methyltransferase YrrM